MNTLLFSSRRCYALFAVLACTLAFTASAQVDPPGRIGRIALLSGTVNLYNPNTGEAFSAPLKCRSVDPERSADGRRNPPEYLR